MQSVPFLRRPSQGLRFSRHTRKGAPEAGSTGSDNPGAAEVCAGLLLLKIGSAGRWEAAWRRSREVCGCSLGSTSISPRPSICGGLERRERIFCRNASGSASRLWGHRLERLFPFLGTPAPDSEVWPVRMNPARRARWRAWTSPAPA